MTTTCTFDVFPLARKPLDEPRPDGSRPGRVQVALFPVITGRTGLDPIFRGAEDIDLELLDRRTLAGNIQELLYRPSRHLPR